MIMSLNLLFFFLRVLSYNQEVLVQLVLAHVVEIDHRRETD